MRFPTMWYVRQAKPQISLRIRAVWSEPLLVASILYDCWATDRTSFRVSKLKWLVHRLVWVYTCQNAILLEITCRGSFELSPMQISFFLFENVQEIHQILKRLKWWLRIWKLFWTEFVNGLKDGTQTTLPVSRRRNGAHGNSPKLHVRTRKKYKIWSQWKMQS